MLDSCSTLLYQNRLHVTRRSLLQVPVIIEYGIKLFTLCHRGNTRFWFVTQIWLKGCADPEDGDQKGMFLPNHLNYEAMSIEWHPGVLSFKSTIDLACGLVPMMR